MTLRIRRASTRVLSILLGIVALTAAAPCAAAQAPPPPPAPPDASQASDSGGQPYLFQEVVTRFRFERDGRGFKEAFIVVKLQTDLGVRQWGQMAFIYTPESEELSVALLEVRKADGTVVRPGASAITDAAVQPGAGINMFEDLRQTHITVPSLGTGDTLALRLVWTTHTPMAPGHFWFEHQFTKDAIVVEERLEIDVPESMTPAIRMASGAPAEASALQGTVADGRRVFRWKSQHLEVSAAADDAPVDDAAEAPVSDVRVSTFADWDAIVRWYGALASPAVTVDASVRAKAAELTKGATTDDERIQALYDFVSTEIRYVSLSFGLGRYSPHPAHQVLTNKYGDCKDKHTLLAAMLKAIGIDAWPVLANTDRKIDPAMASPAEFNHLLTVIPRGKSPADWLWLDTTPGMAPYRMLLAGLRDRDVLLVAPAGLRAGGPVIRTPADPPFPMSTTLEITGKLDTLGALNGVVRYTCRGDEEVVLRSVFLSITVDQRQDVAKGIAEAMGLDGDITGVKVANLESTHHPLVFEFTVRRAGFFKWTATGATLTLPLPPTELPYAEEADWKNRARGELGSPRTTTMKMAIELPPGYTPTLPVGIDVSRDGFAFTSAYSVESGRIVAQRVFRSAPAEIVAASAPAYLAFVRAVRADEAQTVAVAFDTKAAPEIPADAKAPELYSAGRAAFTQGRFDAAVAYWKALTAVNEKHDSVWVALGLAYERMKRPDDAIAAFVKQTEVSPFHTRAFKDLARVLKNQGKVDEARKALVKHVEITPLDGGALSDLGGWLIDSGEYADAVSRLEKAVAIARNDAWAHARLGAAHAGLKAPAKARASFEQAIAILPEPAIWSYAGWHLAQHGLELSWAEQLCRKTLTHAGETLNAVALADVTDAHRDLVERVAWSWDALGWIHFQRGEAVRAERYVKAAWILEASADTMDHLGQIYEKQSRVTDAGSAYLVALALAPSSPHIARHARRVFGEDAPLGRLLAAAPGAAMTERPVRLTPEKPVDGKAELNVLVRQDGSIAEVGFGNGDEAMRAVFSLVQATTYPMQFPDDAIAQLPLEIGIQCRPVPSECLAGILPTRSWRK